MIDYASNATLDDVARRLGAAEGAIVVLTHAKPDGDALGSALALAATLTGLGKRVETRFVGPVVESLTGLAPGGDAVVIDPAADDAADRVPRDAALYVVVDTGAYGQLGPAADAVAAALDRTVVIDHHLSGDVDAATRFIDGTAAACCEVVADLVAILNGAESLTEPVAALLFAGVAADTGWFRFSNTTPRTHRLAARLLEAGVDHNELYARLEQSERPAKLKLLVRAVRSLELLCGDRVALMSLRKSDFEDAGAHEHETDRLVDVPQTVGSVRVVALVAEATAHHGDADTPLTRVSFRSKPGEDAVNVAELAGRFGGGGHARAAGARIEAPLDEVVERLRATLPEALGGCPETIAAEAR